MAEDDDFDPTTVPNLVMVYRSSRMDAEFMRALLESNGIPAITSGEGYASAYPMNVGVFGERRILVREQDQERALALIEEATKGDFELDENSYDE